MQHQKGAHHTAHLSFHGGWFVGAPGNNYIDAHTTNQCWWRGGRGHNDTGVVCSQRGGWTTGGSTHANVQRNQLPGTRVWQTKCCRWKSVNKSRRKHGSVNHGDVTGNHQCGRQAETGNMPNARSCDQRKVMPAQMDCVVWELNEFTKLRVLRIIKSRVDSRFACPSDCGRNFPWLWETFL